MTVHANDAHPYPIYNARFRVIFPILDADGDLVTGAASLDSEASQDSGTFADVTNEATEIATSSGMYYLDLIATEMDTTSTTVIVKTATAGAKTTPLTLHPVRLPVLRTGTAQAGAATTITLDSGASADDDYYNGCYVNPTNSDPANVLGQARKITDYVGSTKVATVGTWGTNPTSATTFEILVPPELHGILWGGSPVEDVTTAGRPEVRVAAIANSAIAAATFAAGAIDAAAIANNAIDDTAIATGAITAAKFAAGAIDAAAIAADAIGASELADGAITAATFAAGAIDATAIANAAIDAATFAAGAIDAAAIANGAIDALTFAAGAIDAAAIANGAIDALTFAAGAIDAAAIANGAIDAATFAAGAIDATAIANGAIDAATFAAGAIDAAALAADAVDEIWDEAMAELAQAAPSATPTMRALLAALYMGMRNAKTVTSTTKTYANDAGTVVFKSALSDDGTTYTEAELVSGP